MFFVLFQASPVVALRFLTTISHIILSSILLMHRSWNIIGCGHEVLANSALFMLKDQEYIAALSLMIGFAGLEIISLVFGLSLYSHLQGFISSTFHASACIGLLFFMFNRTCVDLVWSIFGVCSLIPLLTEIVTISRICVCKRLPAW